MLNGASPEIPSVFPRRRGLPRRSAQISQGDAVASP